MEYFALFLTLHLLAAFLFVLTKLREANANVETLKIRSNNLEFELDKAILPYYCYTGGTKHSYTHIYTKENVKLHDLPPDSVFRGCEAYEIEDIIAKCSGKRRTYSHSICDHCGKVIKLKKE